MRGTDPSNTTSTTPPRMAAIRPSVVVSGFRGLGAHLIASGLSFDNAGARRAVKDRKRIGQTADPRRRHRDRQNYRQKLSFGPIDPFGMSSLRPASGVR